MQKFQSRKSSAPLIKINNTTSPDASSSQESIPTPHHYHPATNGNMCPYIESHGVSGGVNNVCGVTCDSIDHSYCLDCDENLKNSQQPCCDGVNCYRSSQYSEVNNLLSNLNRLTSCNCDECHQLWFDGSVVNSKLQVPIQLIVCSYLYGIFWIPTVFAYFKSLQTLIFQSHHRIHQLNVTSSIGTKVAPQDPMTDEQVIMELRRRSRHRGHQIVGYRRKLMQQVKKNVF